MFRIRKTTVFLIVLALVIAITTSACSNGQTRSTPTVYETPTAIPGPATCEPDKWSLVLQDYQTWPSIDGKKFILVLFAVKNNSAYAGELDLDSWRRNDWVATSENGIKYNNLNPNSIAISRQDGIYLSLNSLYSEPAIGIWETPVIPPGFFFLGSSSPYGGELGVTTYASLINSLVFEVDDSQNQFKITGPEMRIVCYENGGSTTESWISHYMEITSDMEIPAIEYPTERPSSEFRSFSDPLEVPGGTVHFENLQWLEGSGKYYLFFTFTNSDQENDRSVYFLEPLYVIGNDGIIRVTPATPVNKHCSKEFSAGPGETASGILCFTARTAAEDNKLVVSMYKGDHKELFIYNIPAP